MSFILSLLTTLVAILVFLLGTKILVQNYFLAFELKIVIGAIASFKSYSSRQGDS